MIDISPPMDNRDRYHEERRRALRHKIHFENCEEDVVGHHPDQQVRIEAEDFNEIVEMMDETLDSIDETEQWNDSVYRRYAEALTNMSVRLEEKLKSWHKRGLTDKYPEEYGESESDGEFSGENQPTRVYEPDDK